MALNLKQKSFLFVTISVIVLLLAYAGFSHYYLEDFQQRILLAHHQEVESGAKTLDDFFTRGINRLNLIANLPGPKHQLPAPGEDKPIQPLPFSDTLHYLVYESDIFEDGVALLDTRGRILWIDPPEIQRLGNSYAAFNLIRDSFKSEPAAGASFVLWESPEKKQAEILLSTQIEVQGVTVGYLVGAIPSNHETIKRAVGNHLEGSSTQIQLVAEDGTVVAGNAPDRLLRQLPYRELALTAAKSKSGDFLNWENGGLASIVAFQNLAVAPWFISSDEEYGSAMAEVNQVRTTLTLFGALIAIVSMGTLIFVVRSFTRPVELLTAQAQKIAAGDTTAHFTADRKDEIGALALTLDDMNTRLNASYERLLQSEKMALMGQVVAGIAHELNNPLTIVMGHAELMAMKGVAEEHRTAVNRIHDGAERASKIVKNLLTFARQKKPERKLTDINHVITKTVDLRIYELKVSNIELQLDLMPNLPMTMCDPHQLQQVFLNLIVNAEHAMLDANGKGLLIIRSQSRNGMIRILFEDNGPGISMENMRRLFDPFFTTKPVGKGTGLGLSICQGIMAEHSGHISAESTLGFGATFIVELPIVASDQVEGATAAAFAARTATMSKRVLVIDDEGGMRELLAEILRQEGHTSVGVRNGKEALQLIEQERFDLIVSDVKMPEIDGPAFYQTLKDRQSPLASKILFVTGDLMNAATVRFLESCGTPWIAKPFDLKTVRETIRKILS